MSNPLAHQPETPPADFLAGQDLDNWPTATVDQGIAFELLRGHCGPEGRLPLLERLEKASDDQGGTYQITLPAWIGELQTQFERRYGIEVGEVILQKTLRWLIRGRYFSK